MASTASSASGLKWPLRLLAAIGPVVATSALDSLATLPNIPGWYAGLAKPPLTPPNAVFGPAWTILFALMAFAVWRILSAAEAGPHRIRALALFYGQLALNAAWSWSFFGARNPALGLVVIAALLAAITATMAAFRPIDRVAAFLLAPYLAWVSFAAYLNLGVWWLNR
jgi:tryptophan-rich sensory protein